METRVIGAVTLGLVMLAAAGGGACSSGKSQSGGVDASDAAGSDGPSDATVADGGGDAGRPACNTLSLAGVTAGNARGSGAAAPAPTGGTIADGTYVFSEAIYYGQTGLAPFPFLRAKITIAGTTMQTIEGDPEVGGVNPDRTFTDTLSVGTTTLVSTPVCPSSSAAPTTLEFTVAAGGGNPDAAAGAAPTLTLFSSQGGMTAALVYAKQ